MLTARGEDVDRIIGLELGADDYLPKAFNPRELVARIRAVLRRMQPEPAAPNASESLIVGDVELSQSARLVRCAGQVVELTSAEFDLLELLLGSAGKVVTREDISQRALGKEYSPFDRRIDMPKANNAACCCIVQTNPAWLVPANCCGARLRMSCAIRQTGGIGLGLAITERAVKDAKVHVAPTENPYT